MQTTDELFATVISRRKWYELLGIRKQFAADIKAEFKAGTLTDERKKDILQKLGYKIASPLMWEMTPNT